MSVRFFIDHITVETGEEVRFEILDSEFGGTQKKLKGTGVASDEIQQLNEREPLSKPVQKRAIRFGVWVKDEDLSLISDLFSSAENRFTCKYYKDGFEWEGVILPDLCSYEEDSPTRLTIEARDFSVLEGQDYPMTEGRITVIEKIAEILSEVAELNIVVNSSWVVDGGNSSQDFLRQIYTDKFALRNYGRTGDEADTPISKLGALEKICSNYGLICKQVGGKWLLQQLSSLGDATDIFQAEYDFEGTLISESQVDRTTSGKVTIESDNNHNPGIKSAKVKFNHRTKVSGIQFPDMITLTASTPTASFEQFFSSSGEQTISLSGSIESFYDLSDLGTEQTAGVVLRVGQYYWDNTNAEWQTTAFTNTINLNDSGRDVSGQRLVFGFVSFNTGSVPSDADSPLEVILNRSVSNEGEADTTVYIGMNVNIANPVASENSRSIDYKLTQSASQSVRVDYPEIWYGDGPTSYALSAITTDENGDEATANDWAIRGETDYLPFAHLLLREVLDFQRTATRRISAIVKSVLSFGDIVSYDSQFFYVLGGTFDAYTGVSNVELLRINIQTDEDTFEDLPKFSDETGQGTGTTGSTGGGLDQGAADDRYFRQSQNLSEGNASTIRTNIGLGTIATFAGNQNLRSTDSPTFVGGTFTGALRGDTLRPDSGKILSPVNIQMRNAGDTAFRDVQMAGLTATTGVFTGVVSVANATAGGHAVNRTTGDGRYGQLGSANTWTGVNTFAANTIIQSGILWVQNDVSYLTGGAIVGSSAIPTYDFEVVGNSQFQDGWVWISDSYLQVDDRLGIGVKPYGGGRLSDDTVQISGSVGLTGDLSWLGGSSPNDYTWGIGPRGADLLNVQNFGSPFAVLSVAGQSVSDPTDVSTNPTEGTLALYRGNATGTNAEFLDFYNNGYPTSHEYGINIQKRGVGEFRRFLFGFDDGSTYINTFTVNTPDGDNNFDLEVDLAMEGDTVINSDRDFFGRDGNFSRNLFVEGGLFAREFVVDQTRVFHSFQMSSFSGKIEAVSGNAGAETITVAEDQGLVVDDIIKIQRRTGGTDTNWLTKEGRQSTLWNDIEGWQAQSGAIATTTDEDSFIGDRSVIVEFIDNASFQRFSSYPSGGTSGIPCSPGDVVRASAWLKYISGDNSVRIGLIFFNSSGSSIQENLSGSISPTEWTRQAATITAPSNAAFVAMRVYATRPSGQNTIPSKWYFDNAQLTINHTAAVVKSIHRKVASVNYSNRTAVLTTAGINWTAANDVGSIEVGDEFIQDGNVSDSDRDHFIRFDISEFNFPAIRFFDGVDDLNKGNEAMRIGAMEEYDPSISGNMGIAGKIGGSLGFLLTETEGLIGGWRFDDAAIKSANQAGGSDGNFTTAGIIQHKDGWISAPNFALGKTQSKIAGFEFDASKLSATGLILQGGVSPKIEVGTSPNFSFSSYADTGTGNISGFNYDQARIWSEGGGDSLVEMLTGDRPAFRFVAENGESLFIGGDFSFDAAADVGKNANEFSPTIISVNSTTLQASGGNSTEFSSPTWPAYRDSELTLLSTWEGRYIRFRMAYEVVANTNQAVIDGDDVLRYPLIDSRLDFIIEIRNGTTVLKTTTQTFKVGNYDRVTAFGFNTSNPTGTLEGTYNYSEIIPSGANNIRIRMRNSLQIITQCFDGPFGTTCTGGSGLTRRTIINPTVIVIQGQEFVSPLGASWVNLASGANPKPRVQIRRDTGQVLAQRLQIEGQNSAYFIINDASNRVELRRASNNTVLASWDL